MRLPCLFTVQLLLFFFFLSAYHLRRICVQMRSPNAFYPFADVNVCSNFSLKVEKRAVKRRSVPKYASANVGIETATEFCIDRVYADRSKCSLHLFDNQLFDKAWLPMIFIRHETNANKLNRILDKSILRRFFRKLFFRHSYWEGQFCGRSSHSNFFLPVS